MATWIDWCLLFQKRKASFCSSHPLFFTKATFEWHASNFSSVRSKLKMWSSCSIPCFLFQAQGVGALGWTQFAQCSKHLCRCPKSPQPSHPRPNSALQLRLQQYHSPVKCDSLTSNHIIYFDVKWCHFIRISARNEAENMQKAEFSIHYGNWPLCEMMPNMKFVVAMCIFRYRIRKVMKLSPYLKVIIWVFMVAYQSRYTHVKPLSLHGGI